MAFPNITPANGVKETSIGSIVQSTFDGNYVQQRLKSTRFRKSFAMSFTLTPTEYDTLDTYFQDSLGTEFSWQHPITLDSYIVRFTAPSLEATWTSNNLVTVDLTLEEV